MPHHPPKHPPHHAPGHDPKPRKAQGTPRGGLPASRILGFVDEAQLDGWLAPLVPDAADRAFVVRCLVGEGPIHHRGSNFILLALLGRAVQAHGGLPPVQAGAAVPMRLPPHLAEGVEDSAYPVQLPVRALRELAGGDSEGAGERLDAMIDCLTDGPPQHALANVVMVALLEGLLPAAPAGVPTAGEQA
jgi:hypothetical protein